MMKEFPLFRERKKDFSNLIMMLVVSPENFGLLVINGIESVLSMIRY